MLSARRAAPVLCSSIGVAWRTAPVAVGTGGGGDGGTNAPRRGKQTLLRAY